MVSPPCKWTSKLANTPERAEASGLQLLEFGQIPDADQMLQAILHPALSLKPMRSHRI